MTAPSLPRDRLLLAVLALLVYLPGLGSRALWNPDEPRYAEVAREMRLTGQYLVPHLNGDVYTQKPPLQFWAIAAFGALRGGVDEVAARLPAVLSVIGVLLLTFQLGLTFAGRRAAWLAAVVVGTAGKVLWQGRIGQIDMQLVFWVSLAMTFFVAGYLQRRPGFYWFFFAATGCATLAKGPAGMLPPLLSVLAFLLATGDRQEIRRLRVGRGLLLWAAVVLLWLVPAGLAGGGEYLEQIVFRQNLTRYVDPWHHHRPWYYYLTVLPGDFFPWSLLLPSALVIGWRRLEGRARQGFLLGLCWLLVTMVFFSLSPAKRTVYILTMYPGMALLMGLALDRLAELWPRVSRRVKAALIVPLLLVALLLGTAAALVPGLAARQPAVASLASWLPSLAVCLAALVAAAAAAGAVLAWRGRPVAATVALAAAMGVVGAAAAAFLLPQFDRLKSARPLSAELLARMQPGEAYAIYPRIDPEFIFYTRRFAELPATEAELREFAARPQGAWVLAERQALEELERPLPLVEMAAEAYREDGYVLLGPPSREISRQDSPDPPAAPEER